MFSAFSFDRDHCNGKLGNQAHGATTKRFGFDVYTAIIR
jgi:hypothetical protein